MKNNIVSFLISCALLLGLSSFLFAETITQRFILDNGMTVLITEIPSAPAVGLQVVVKSGSVTEGKYLGSGLSHFIEHMLFKGTTKRGVGDIAKEIKSLGGIINASTSFDYTSYTIELPFQSFNQALDILSDMLMNSRFDPQETEKEREVIFGEMRLHKDSPESRLSDLVFANVYTRHPYRHPVIGYEPLFRAIPRDSLFEYYKDVYSPNNMIFSVAGNIKTKETLEAVKNTFADFKPRPCLMRSLPIEPTQVASRTYEEYFSTDNLTRISLAFQGLSLSSKDMFALDTLAVILGQGESSRLYQDIVKKEGLVYSISASNFTPMDQGLFEITSTLDGEKVNQVIGAIKKEIEQIKKGGIAKEELEKVKRQVLSNYLFDNQKAADVAANCVMNEAFIADANFSKKYIEAIRALTVEDIKRVVNQYLIDSSLTIVILRPKKSSSDIKASSKEIPVVEIKKFSLNNGMTVLLREDHTFPLVSLRLALQGGLRQEKDLENGLSNLTAQIWTKGTKTKTSAQIAKMAEERGMSLSAFSGQNSFGLESNVLSEDTELALNLIEDMVKNPTFPDEEIKKEMAQIKSGIAQRDDEVFLVSRKTLRENLFLKHPYRREVLGTLDSVSALKRDDILNFYKKLCVPDNMVLAVYGDVDSAKILSLIKTKFSTLIRKDLDLVKYEESPVKEMRGKELTMDKSQAIVMIGFQAPTLGSKDRYACEIVSSLLGSPLNSRIFNKIRDELGSSYNLGSSYSPGIDAGWIYFYVATTDKEVEKVKEVLWGQIEEMQKTLVSDKELEDTKVYLKGMFSMSLETNSTLSYVTSSDELYGLGFENYKRYNEEIDKVTKEDLMQIAKSYLTVNQAAVVVTKSRKEESAKK